MLGNTSIPVSEQIDWVWEQVARLHPEFKREPWEDHNDPHMIHEHVNENICSFAAWPGARVMDIGANVGVFTVLCALNGATVTAYEPNAWAFKLLLKHIEATGMGERVTPVNSLVWVHPGPVRYKEATGRYYPALWDTYNGLVPTDKHKGTEAFQVNGLSVSERDADAVSFDDAIGNQEWDCVKMDIEGGEFEVLLAASDEALRRVKFLTVELHTDWVDKALYCELITKLERLFSITGTKSQGCWASLYATRRTEQETARASGDA